jgi:acyl carrier protein
MTTDEIRGAVIKAIGEVAPEAELASLKLDDALRDQLDIDSVDFLNFAIALHKEFKVDIPEVDYPRLSTLKGCVEYLSERCVAGHSAAPPGP